jgi:hypothetical protein
VLKFGRRTYRFSGEITAVYKLSIVGWHCDLLIYMQGFKKIIQSFKFGRYEIFNRRAENSMVNVRIPYVTKIKIRRISHSF